VDAECHGERAWISWGLEGRCHGECKLDVTRWSLNVTERGTGFHGDWKVGVMGTGRWTSGGDQAIRLGEGKQDVTTNGRCI
jgi:hypothetical protein